MEQNKGKPKIDTSVSLYEDTAPPREFAGEIFYTPERRDLTASQTEVLQLLARGKIRAEIAKELDLSERSVDSIIRIGICSRLDVRTIAAAVFSGVYRGIVNPTEAVGDRMPERIPRLTAREIEVLDVLTREGNGSTDLEIAAILGVQERTVAQHFAKIFTDFSIHNRVTVGLIYLARHDEFTPRRLVHRRYKTARRNVRKI